MDFTAYYDSYWTTKDDNYDASRLDLMVRHVYPGDRVLVLDCGLGLEGKLMLDRGAEVVGTDLSVIALERARARGLATYRVNLDLEAVPFTPETFDVVVSNSRMEHLMQPENVLREAVRMLKPSGRLILMVPNIGLWRYRLWLLQGRFPYIENSPTDKLHIRMFTLVELRKLLSKHGFSIKHVSGNSGLWNIHLYPSILRRRGIANLYELAVKIWPSLFARYLCLVCQKER